MAKMTGDLEAIKKANPFDSNNYVFQNSHAQPLRTADLIRHCTCYVDRVHFPFLDKSRYDL